MTKNTIAAIIVLLVIVVFGTGYFLNHRTGKQPLESNAGTTGNGKSLDMSGQQLTEVPTSVTDQTDLTSLNLSNNQLTTLPAAIGSLVNLEVLNVENNRLESLPAAIGQLKNLRTADFSNNRLTSLPPELGTLTGLKFLNLGGYKSAQSDIEQLKTRLPNTEIKM